MMFDVCMVVLTCMIFGVSGYVLGEIHGFDSGFSEALRVNEELEKDSKPK